jgi:hypothetical protein
MTRTPGHQTSLHMIESEAYDRILSGLAPDTLDQLAAQLLAWFRESHPGAASLTRRHDLIRGG